MKQLAVVKPRTWYQAHCNECGTDVGGFSPKQDMAQLDANVHNERVHGAEESRP